MTLRLALLALAVPAAVAQQAAPPDVHAVPFATADNAIELTVESALADGLSVAVAGAPSWLRFASPSVPVQPGEGGALARLVFDVGREAPVGVPAVVRLDVVAGGAVVATREVRVSVSAPAALDLGSPYPNPAAGTVTVPYVVPGAGPARVAVYDVLGREVAVLVDGEHEPGAFEARLPGAAVAAGVYVVRLTAGAEGRTRSLTVVR